MYGQSYPYFVAVISISFFHKFTSVIWFNALDTRKPWVRYIQVGLFSSVASSNVFLNVVWGFFVFANSTWVFSASLTYKDSLQQNYMDYLGRKE